MSGSRPARRGVEGRGGNARRASARAAPRGRRGNRTGRAPAKRRERRRRQEVESCKSRSDLTLGLQAHRTRSQGTSQAAARARPGPGPLTSPGALRRPCARSVSMDGALTIVRPMSSRPFIRQCLRKRVEVELDHAAVGPADLLRLQVDRERRVGAALGVVEQLVEIFRRDVIGRMPFLKQLL